MTVNTRHEIVVRRRMNAVAGLALAAIAAALYAVCRLTGSGAFDRLTTTL